MRPILIVSAFAEELGALVGRLDGSERRRIGGLAVTEGLLGGREVCLAAAGEGRRLAANALGRLLPELAPEAILGVGVAGGLTADLRPGDLVLGERLIDSEGGTYEPPPWWWSDPARRIGRLAGGTVVTVNRVAQTPAEKRRIATALGLGERSTVDLESASWVRAAADGGSPWLVLRSVSDAVDERLPLDFDRFRNEDGRISRRRVVAHALVRPRLLVELRRLRRRVAGCSIGLADAAEALLAW